MPVNSRKSRGINSIYTEAILGLLARNLKNFEVVRFKPVFG
jgi:hypothetical protein